MTEQCSVYLFFYKFENFTRKTKVQYEKILKQIFFVKTELKFTKTRINKEYETPFYKAYNNAWD